MSFFGSLFGPKRKEPPAKLPTPSVREGENKPPDGKKFQVYDKFGREMIIGAADWRKLVLPMTLKAHWNDPIQLSGVINDSLDNGFFEDVLDASRQLFRIDSNPVRGATVHAFTLLKNGQLSAAEKILRAYLEKHGEHPLVLTNLAKVTFERNEKEETERILWRVLELDPNEENALPWYAAMLRERSGPDAEVDAFKRAAVLPNSWQPQRWLGKMALSHGRLEEALTLFQECLARAPKPVPKRILMTITGDLGNAGHLPELLNIAQAHFDPKVHGLTVGNNIIKALIDVGQLDGASRVVNQLHAVKTPDWQQRLLFWETEIAKARRSVSDPPNEGRSSLTMVVIEGPVWLKPSSATAELFPAKPAGGPSVAFLCFSAEKATNSKRVEQQLSDHSGRLTRGLPLFLAEQAEFHTNARVQTLVPWVTQGGFAVSGTGWDNQDAAEFARNAEPKSDFVVTGHFKTQTESWPLELRFIRTIDSKCLETISTTLAPDNVQAAFPNLSDQLFRWLTSHAEAQAVTPPAIYRVPANLQFAYYLLRLEQLLAVLCGGMDGVRDSFLTGAREIIDGNIALCVDNPNDVCVRILLANTLLAMKRARREIIPEFKEKIALLQQEHALSNIPYAVINRIIADAFAG